MDRSRRPEDIPERLLARLWRNRDWRRRSLPLADGKRLRVLYPGRPGGGPGPDFRDAILQVEGRAPVRGDVELHREPRGFEERAAANVLGQFVESYQHARSIPCFGDRRKSLVVYR